MGRSHIIEVAARNRGQLLGQLGSLITRSKYTFVRCQEIANYQVSIYRPLGLELSLFTMVWILYK